MFLKKYKKNGHWYVLIFKQNIAKRYHNNLQSSDPQVNEDQQTLSKD